MSPLGTPLQKKAATEIQDYGGDSPKCIFDGLPRFLTADEVASLLLRTTRKAVYIMAERGLLPGVTRIGRRILFRTDILLDWLHQKSAPSPME